MLRDELDDAAETLIGYMRDEFVDEFEKDWRGLKAMGSWSGLGWPSGDIPADVAYVVLLVSMSEPGEWFALPVEGGFPDPC